MSIKLTTNCGDCVHRNVCRYKNNAANAMKKLKDMNYGKGPNDDYGWDIMMSNQHVDITFSCPDFRKYDPAIVCRG